MSGIGKSHLINRLIEQDFPNAVKFRGAGGVNVGVAERWFDYNYWMHNNMEQLDKLNEYRINYDAVHSFKNSICTQGKGFLT